MLGDFCDGSLFQTHPLFSSDPHALQVIAYYDELEVVNPIGSYISKHKLGCLFFFLANVRPQFRSTYKAIHLVAVARSQDIKKYGIDDFLTPFVEDLKELYCDGVAVSVLGKDRTFYGGLLAFLADTLAAHELGGFKGSMSFALRICRSCMITSSQLKKCLVESECQLRNAETHFEQCDLLTGPLQEHYSTTFGINRLSILEEVPGFSVVTGLPHDIMHDLFEGVVPYELKLFIRHCVCSKYFTIETLNERINAYDFGNNSPTVIDTRILNNPSMKIRQSASQMMSLSKEFPMLVADMIPEDDPNWYSFLVLLKICSIAVSPVCSYDTIAYLRVLVEEKLDLFIKLYSDHPVIPKQHYMLHYPSQIARLGPLIQSWNMRQESKLSFIKRVSRRSNYKNVCLTVAKKHQFWLCHQMTSSPHLLRPQLDQSSKVRACLLNEEEDFLQREILGLMPDLALDTTVMHPHWIHLQSSRLCHGVYVVLNYDVIKPVFGKVVDIALVGEIVILCVLEFYGQYFNSHYNAFEVTHQGVYKAVSIDTLFDHRPVCAKHSFLVRDNSLYISLPYIM